MAIELMNNAVIGVDISQGIQVDIVIGTEGPPGVGGAQLSPDAGNVIEARENGLYVPSVLASTQW